eukprot:maker-scaffold57_size444674-snap-gene-2.13 protein:Tk04368 transcript:maker-scaffold57_size444674-snap-gene-2.13-mRNA-1 annotation:"hypothetical protein DAPPUDRAFT_193650"
MERTSSERELLTQTSSYEQDLSLRAVPNHPEGQLEIPPTINGGHSNHHTPIPSVSGGTGQHFVTSPVPPVSTGSHNVPQPALHHRHPPSQPMYAAGPPPQTHAAPEGGLRAGISRVRGGSKRLMRRARHGMTGGGVDGSAVDHIRMKLHDKSSADPEGPGIAAFLLTALSVLLIAVTMPFSLCLCIKVVTEYERAVIFRLGRLRKGGSKGPGIFTVIPCIDTYKCVDLRTVSFDVPPQEILSRDSVTVSVDAVVYFNVIDAEQALCSVDDFRLASPASRVHLSSRFAVLFAIDHILSKDSVTVAVDAVVYYRVSNPTICISNVENFSHSTRLLAATTLRNVLGTKNLAEILSERETISHIMQSSLDEATDPWGVKVERVEIKDVRLPVQLQRAMAAEAEAAREARAKVIAAEGEQKASRALKEAAEVIQQSPAALQLRYLQTLTSISAEKNSTIIFPLPIDLRYLQTLNSIAAEHNSTIIFPMPMHLASRFFSNDEGN